jgi:hypothetical protein
MSVYTLEKRTKAVTLYFQWGRDSAAARCELGYPSRKARYYGSRSTKAPDRLTIGTAHVSPNTPRNKNRPLCGVNDQITQGPRDAHEEDS